MPRARSVQFDTLSRHDADAGRRARPRKELGRSADAAALPNAQLAVVLVGERPGFSSSDSLGVCMPHTPTPGLTGVACNGISNGSAAGLPVEEAVRKPYPVGTPLPDACPAWPARTTCRPAVCRSRSRAGCRDVLWKKKRQVPAKGTCLSNIGGPTRT